MEKSNLALPIAIVLAGALIAGVMFYNNKTEVAQKAQDDSNSIISDFSVALPQATDSVLGNPNADVVVIEYSDTECPFCKTFHTTMQQIMDVYGKDGKVAWIYRHMPLDALHKKARTEAQAVECAKVQGGTDMFWKYINEVFTRTKSNDSLPGTELAKIASDLKLDVTKFNSCLSSNETADIVKSQEATGREAGVQGTPNNFLVFKKPLSEQAQANLIAAFAKYPPGTVRISKDGKVINLGGAMPYNLMTFVIDNALAQ